MAFLVPVMVLARRGGGPSLLVDDLHEIDRPRKSELRPKMSFSITLRSVMKTL